MKAERVEKREWDVVVDETIHIQLTQEELNSFEKVCKFVGNTKGDDGMQEGFDLLVTLLNIFRT